VCSNSVDSNDLVELRRSIRRKLLSDKFRSERKEEEMAAAQYTDYYYNNNISSYYQQSAESQQQNLYGYGQYDCKNLSVNDAFNNYNYNHPPNNYNDQWSSYYSTIQHQQPQYHHQHQLSMLNNQINDDYSHHNYNSNIKSTQPANESRPNLNCNQYVDVKNDLYYGQQQQQHFAQSTAIAPATTSQLAGESRKRKIDNVATASSDDSPALRALLTKPSKRARYVKSPYFYHHTGNVSPASSTSEHYQVPASIVNAEQSINLVNYKSPLKEGYESSIDEIKAVVSTASPISSSYATPPSSPKDTSLKHDDSAHSGAAIWNEQNEGKIFLFLQ
jgi:hypothetical protein